MCLQKKKSANCLSILRFHHCYSSFRIPLYSSLLFFGVCNSISAAPWRMGASVLAAEEYTNSSSGSIAGQDEFVTELKPSLNISRQGARVKVQGDYAYQYFLYANNTQEDHSNHSLSGRGDVELIRNRVFFNALSQLSRRIVDPLGPIPISQSTATENQSDVWVNTLGMQVTERHKRYAQTNANYTYSWRKEFAKSISDSQTQSASAGIVNGSYFTHLLWSASAQYQSTNYEDRDSIENGFAQAMLGYRFSPKYNLRYTAGYEINPKLNNTSQQQDIRGTFWVLQANWIPSRKLNMTADYGERSYGEVYNVSVTLKPTVRTTLQGSYGETVFGETYSGNLNHRRKRSTWSFLYTESLTTRSYLELIEQQVRLADSEGNVLVDETGRPIVVGVVFPVISDSVFINKTANANVSFKGKHNTLTFTAIFERRLFQDTSTEDKRYSAGATWIHRLNQRANMSTNYTREELRYDIAARSDSINRFDISYNHKLGKRLDASLIFRYLNRDSNQVDGNQENYVIRAQAQYRF